jgi:hypothetical protein
MKIKTKGTSFCYKSQKRYLEAYTSYNDGDNIEVNGNENRRIHVRFEVLTAVKIFERWSFKAQTGKYVHHP